MQDISKQYGWSWQFETTLGLAAHSYAESGAHGIPPINPQQKLGGIYLHLLIAFTLQRKHDYHQREGYVFLPEYVKEVMQLVLYRTLKVTVRLQIKRSQRLLWSRKGTEMSRCDFWASL